jgi:tight adherence protein B
MDPRLLTFLSFAAISLFAAAVLMFIFDVVVRRRELVAGRLRDPASREDLPRLPVGPEGIPARTLWGRINQWFDRLEQENGTDQPPEAVFWWETMAGLLLGGILWLWQQNFIIAVVGFLIGNIAVTALFVCMRARRRREMREQLPEVMDMMARAVRAGQTLDQAITLAGETAQAPLKDEFVRAAKHLDMGLSLEGAIRALTRRAPLPETRILAATLMVQRRAGGSLPVTLERLAHVIRDRLSYQRQFRAATAAGRMSMFIIVLAGPLVVAYLWFFQREYIENLIVTPEGHMMLMLAIALQVIGTLWILSLLRSDY